MNTRLTGRPATSRLGAATHRASSAFVGAGQRDLTVDASRLAASVELRDPPNAHQRVRPATQHQLLQITDLCQVPCLRRREDPLPQTPYVLLDLPPVDRRSSPGNALGSVHRTVGTGQRLAPPAVSPWRPTCPSVPASLSTKLFTGSPGPRQHPFGSGQPPVSGQLSETDRRRSRPAVPVSCRLSAHRHSLLGPSCSRWGVRPSSRSAAPDHTTAPGPQRGFHVPHERDTTGVGAPYTPRRRCPPGRHGSLPASACRFPTASPAPRCNNPSAGLTITRHHQGFTHVHPSGLPLACGPRMERETLGLYP